MIYKNRISISNKINCISKINKENKRIWKKINRLHLKMELWLWSKNKIHEEKDNINYNNN